MGRARHVIWPNQKTCIVILSCILAAGIMQDTFTGEAGEGERRRRSGDDWRLLLPTWPGILPVLAIEFLSHITNTRTRIRNVRTYIYIFITYLPRSLYIFQ